MGFHGYLDVRDWPHVTSATTCDKCDHMWQVWPQVTNGKCPNVRDVQLSMMSKCPWCGHTCYMWSHLSHVVTFVTYCHSCHMLSHLSHIVTCCHTCHMEPHLSHVVTLVTRNRYFNNWPKGLFVVLWLPPTYRPAWPQVKMKVIWNLNLWTLLLLNHKSIV